MSATHASIMVKTFGEMDSDIVDVLKQGQMQSQVLKQGKMQSDVLKQRQMQSDKLTRQFNSPTKPSLAGATKVLTFILFFYFCF
jgi:BRCA1-associated RING domain protein 1